MLTMKPIPLRWRLRQNLNLRGLVVFVCACWTFRTYTWHVAISIAWLLWWMVPEDWGVDDDEPLPWKKAKP